ncbi:MAG: hypothetical protein ACT4P4_16635 [Betaproteobacteria bacterium]
MRTIVLAALALAAVLGAAQAQAQYPAKPVSLVVAWPAGGPTDTIARIMARKLGDALGQQVLVENKPGAAGMEVPVDAPRAAKLM